MFTSQKLQTVLNSLAEGPPYCVAYSGGMDSHVLLHALFALHKDNPEYSFRAVHINHDLNPRSDSWEAHCKEVCKALKISFTAKKIEVLLKPGESLESVARTLRYQALREVLKPDECLLTGHTMNDQTETLLLQLLRGAGVKGLASMPLKKKWGGRYFLRPLLSFDRDELQHYATQNGLQWIEDTTNLELRFNRNYLRHEVVPVLQERWPELVITTSRSAQLCAEAADLLDELADRDLKRVQHKQTNTLIMDPLLKLSVSRQRNLLRRWIHRNGFRMPSAKHIEHIQKDVLLASAKANPVFNWSGAEIRRYQRQLFIMEPLTKSDYHAAIPWNFRKPLVLPAHMGTLIARKKRGVGLSTELDVNRISVRFRNGSERCRPVGYKRSRPLKKWMQAWNIPPWCRDRIPLVYYDKALIAVVGYCYVEGFATSKHKLGWMIANPTYS